MRGCNYRMHPLRLFYFLQVTRTKSSCFYLFSYLSLSLSFSFFFPPFFSFPFFFLFFVNYFYLKNLYNKIETFILSQTKITMNKKVNHHLMYFFTMMIKKLPDETKGSPSHHKIPLNLLLPNPLQLKQPFLSLSNLLHLFFIPLHPPSPLSNRSNPPSPSSPSPFSL